MKKVQKVFALIMHVVFISIIFLGCSSGEDEKEKIVPPSIVMNEITEVTYKSAVANLSVTIGSKDLATIGLRYVLEGNTDTLEISNIKIDAKVSFKMEGLNRNSKYYVYAYVKTIDNLIYKSPVKVFTTIDGEKPNVSQIELLGRTTESVLVSCTAESNEDFPITEKGYYLSFDPEMSNVEKVTVDNLDTEIGSLVPRKVYYLQAYAINEIGESTSSTLLFETKSLNGQWTYAFSADGRCSPVAASDGKSIYYGLGTKAGKIYQDWYKYDPNDNSITALNDFPGVVAYGVNDNNAFYIDGYIYVTCSDKSFWAYNINENKWTPKTSTLFERGHSMGLSINGKGYYGTGEMGGNRFTDISEYNPQTDNWTKIADTPFNFTRNAYFSIGDDIYFVARYYDYNSDFYKYNIKTKEWTKLKDFPGIGIQDTFGFSIGSRGYVVLGIYDENGDSQYTTELWEYTPLYDEWERKMDYPNKVIGVAGCVIDEKAYVGCGFTYSTPGYPLSSFYVFNPDK